MMYEGGWGKKLTYIISCSCFETVDVTRRYTSKWQEVLQRRLEVPELWLSRTLAQLNTQMQFQMMLPDSVFREHEARRSSEAQQLLDMHPQARTSQPLFSYVFVACVTPPGSQRTPCCRGKAARSSGVRPGAKWARDDARSSTPTLPLPLPLPLEVMPQ